MTDASSDSDESAGRTQDWEVVSLTTLSLSGSTGGNLCACEVCTSAMEAGGTGSGRSAGSGIIDPAGGPQANFLSNHFGSAGDHTTTTRSPMLDQFLGSEGQTTTVPGAASDEEEEERRLSGVLLPMESDEDVDGNPNNNDTNNNDENPFVDMDVEEESHVTVDAAAEADNTSYGKQEEENDDEEGVAANYSPEMDWIEPTTPNSSSNLMREEESDVASNSCLIYDMGCEKKPSAGSDYRETAAGPLLGSCMVAPSAAAIVSSVAAFRAGLGEDIVQNSMGGEESAIAGSCVVEEELAGLEREILGTDSGFESFHETPVVHTKKLGLEDRHGVITDALLDGDDGTNEDQSSCEAWWKRRAALWFVEARQANTLWSLALAAAVMGLVILGQRWQHERCQNNHLRMQLCRKDEKISQLIFQVARLKDALSGRRRVPVLRSSSSYSSFRDRF